MNRQVSKALFMMAILVLASICHTGNAETEASREYMVKAAFLYNFVKFVEWPSETFTDDKTPITIGIFGKNPFGAVSEAMKSRTVCGRHIEIRQFEGTEDLKKCHVFFISRSERKNLAKIITKLSGWNVLTVSDIENFAQKEGIIGFVNIEDKLRFEINLEAAKRADLKISAKLLHLAKIVKEKQ